MHAQGTGTADEMALEERTTVATEGCVIADVAIVRPPQAAGAQPRASTSGRVRLQELVAPAFIVDRICGRFRQMPFNKRLGERVFRVSCPWHDG